MSDNEEKPAGVAPTQPGQLTLKEVVAKMVSEGRRLVGWYVAPDVATAIEKASTKVETGSELFPHLYTHPMASPKGTLIIRSALLPPGCICPVFENGHKPDDFWPFSDLEGGLQ